MLHEDKYLRNILSHIYAPVNVKPQGGEGATPGFLTLKKINARNPHPGKNPCQNPWGENCIFLPFSIVRTPWGGVGKPDISVRSPFKVQNPCQMPGGCPPPPGTSR